MKRTIERIQAEFTEMPGLRLTTDQVRRLCGVDPLMCTAVLDALVDAHFLARRSDGTYVRGSEGPVRAAAGGAAVAESVLTGRSRLWVGERADVGQRST